jgi:hypothetical protein
MSGRLRRDSDAKQNESLRLMSETVASFCVSLEALYGSALAQSSLFFVDTNVRFCGGESWLSCLFFR